MGDRNRLVRWTAAAATFTGLLLALPHREARATESDGIWLWKDLKGKCPATCDRNQYECPCTTAALEQ
jgi:hypothetical protein